jgi:hypothetical protein
VSAHITNERFDLVVHRFDVFRQRFGIGENFVANFTDFLRIPTRFFRIFTRAMCSNVLIELSYLRKFLITIRAGITFCCAMDLNVIKNLDFKANIWLEC